MKREVWQGLDVFGIVDVQTLARIDEWGCATVVRDVLTPSQHLPDGHYKLVRVDEKPRLEVIEQ